MANRYVVGDTSIDSVRGFVRNNYNINLEGGSRMKQDMAGRKTVIFFNHYRQGPEISGFPNNPDLGAGLAGHDFAPILAKLFADEAFSETGVRVARAGKPLYPKDEFYYRSAKEVGNILMSEEGVEQVATQFQQAWGRGLTPTICPEAGLRCLKQWKSGGVVAATLAGADTVTLVTESPWISLIDRSAKFHYVGALGIPQEVKEAVWNKEDNVVNKFNDGLRREMARALVRSNYEPAYTREVAQFAK